MSRTGRAVSRDAGEPYKDRLLILPPFLLSAQGGLTEGDIRAGLDLTGHFLERDLLTDRSRPITEARHRLVERLRRAGGLA